MTGNDAVRGRVLELRGVGKAFGATRALDHVDLDLYAGEVQAWVGENGAGMFLFSGGVDPEPTLP